MLTCAARRAEQECGQAGVSGHDDTQSARPVSLRRLVIDVFVSSRRHATAARRFFQQAIQTTRITLADVVTDKAATCPIVIDELLPAVWHRIDWPRHLTPTAGEASACHRPRIRKRAPCDPPGDGHRAGPAARTAFACGYLTP